jgi:predicted NBD/HSP70 family sugar kinase
MNTIPLRSNDIRERNEKLVLGLIHAKKRVSQSEVAALTGLKPPTVFRIFAALEEKGLIVVAEEQKDFGNKKGRRPVSYQLRPDVFYMIGVDFWAKAPSVVVVDFTGKPLYSSDRDFPSDIEAESAFDLLVSFIEEAIRTSKIQRDRILGIGVGAPGRVDTSSGVIIAYPRIRGMSAFPIRARLEERFSVPVYVHNNCSIIALSEYRYGIARKAESLLAILIRAGVGGAFVQGGKLFVNKNRTTLEIGHMSIDAGGRRCSCGRRGCLETYLSEDAIMTDIGLEGKDFLGIEKKITAADPAALKVLKEKGEILTLAVTNLLHIFGPDTVLLVSRSHIVSEHLADLVRKNLEKSQDSPPAEIVSADYDPALSGKAATDLVIENFLTRIESV